jgi:hypothetical protein
MKSKEQFSKIKNDNQGDWDWKVNSVVYFGGSWRYPINSGTLCSAWATCPSDYYGNASGRFVCPHLRK